MVGAFWIIRAITQPIQQAVQISRAVAAGDLSMQFEAQGNNETGQLLLALKDMQASLFKVCNVVVGWFCCLIFIWVWCVDMAS